MDVFKAFYYSAIIVSLLLLGLTAYADSDAYYCIGDNYFAYETRFSVSGEGHKLNIVYLDKNKMITGPSKVDLEDFQLQGMQCADHNTVKIQSWNHVFTVDISNRENPKISNKEKTSSPGQKLPDFESNWLRAWSMDSRYVNLPFSDSYDYELAIVKSSKSNIKPELGGGIIYYYTSVHITQKDPTGKPIKRIRLLDLTDKETIS